MGTAGLHTLISAALIAGAPTQDTATYADRATRELVALAMARHRAQDSTVRDYQATVRYRMSFAFGKRKWADIPAVAVEEQQGKVSWELPNNLRIDIQGQRSASQYEGMNLSSTFSRPWFVPRTLGDSIRVFGSDDPTRAAPHPLGPVGERLYRFAAGDSLAVTTAGRRVVIRSITVTPKGKAPAVVAGRLWVDVATGDVVRFTFRFVGTDLWSSPDGATHADSAAAHRENRIISRILQLDADLEYALQDGKYWMPYRQVLSGRITVPLGIDVVVPFEAATRFDDYAINSGTHVVFDAPFLRRDSVGAPRNSGTVNVNTRRGRGGQAPPPDSVRGRGRNRTGYLASGGRFQIHRPSQDSLKQFTGWGDSLVFNGSPADRRRIRGAAEDLAHLAESLPSDMTGRPGAGIALERLNDVLRYNRVQGTTLSMGGRTPAPTAFTQIFGAARIGLADNRLMARVAAIRDAPGGRLTVALSRDLVDVDAFAKGLTLGNSLRGIFVGRDDGAYLLAQGARIDYETSVGLGSELSFGARVEHHTSVSNAARAGVPRLVGDDGFFPENPAARGGLAVGGVLRVEHPVTGVRWSLQGEGWSVDGAAAGRVVGELRFQRLLGGWLMARAKGGVAAGVDSVPQLSLRAGGLNTVRGYDFGVATGDGVWAVQLDIAKPGRGVLKPVIFLDAGQAGNLADFGAAPFLSGAGVGFSLLGGLMRAELSYPLTERHGRGLRFDFVFGGPR